MSVLLPVYLRLEPSRDDLARTLRKYDVVAYRNRECTKHFARWAWYQRAGRPTKSSRTVRLNCFTWAVRWVKDVEYTYGDIKP